MTAATKHRSVSTRKYNVPVWITSATLVDVISLIKYGTTVQEVKITPRHHSQEYNINYIKK